MNALLSRLEAYSGRGSSGLRCSRGRGLGGSGGLGGGGGSSSRSAGSTNAHTNTGTREAAIRAEVSVLVVDYVVSEIGRDNTPPLLKKNLCINCLAAVFAKLDIWQFSQHRILS
jgi:hypothetical protein